MLVDSDGKTAPDLVAFVKGLVGYSATGHTSEQFFALLAGTGANGKSVFIDTLRRVFSEVTSTTPLSTFEEKSSGSSTTD